MENQEEKKQANEGTPEFMQWILFIVGIIVAAIGFAALIS